MLSCLWLESLDHVFPCHNKLRGPRPYWWKFSAYIFYQFKYNLQSWNLHKSQIGKNKLGICWFASSLLTPGLHTAALTAARGDNLQINCRTHIHISVISQTWLILSTYITTDVCVINFFSDFDTLNIKLCKESLSKYVLCTYLLFKELRSHITGDLYASSEWYSV